MICRKVKLNFCYDEFDYYFGKKMKIKQAVTLLSSLILSSAVLAASQSNERWFDIEVILISQLADKSGLKEVFADDKKLPHFSKPLDLLTPYLSPDIAHLKQQLPFCNSENQLFQYHESAKLPSTIAVKSLESITDELNQPIVTSAEFKNANNTKLINTLEQEQSKNDDDFYSRVVTDKAQTYTQEGNVIPSQEQFNNIDDIHRQESNIDTTLTPEQVALVNAAEAYFSPIQFTYSSNVSTNSKLLCQITKSEFESLSPDKSRYSYLGFPINKVPSEISDIENLYNTAPYLLNKDSLALHDIVKQLRRSRDFRPILHIGWRQPVSSRRRAIPVKLFAGDNLQQHYLDELALYQAQKTQLLAQEQSLNTLLSENANDKEVLTEESQFQQNKEKQLARIIEKLATVTDDTSTLIADLEKPPLALELDSSAPDTFMFEPPKPPIQPWYLQGFMQIYINNNNRLNILADFNMLNLTLAEQETMKLRPNTPLNLQTITFKQRRQVISTETHYFDHPYMGMIVQIRRHKRPELPEN